VSAAVLSVTSVAIVLERDFRYPAIDFVFIPFGTEPKTFSVGIVVDP
jgi:hypothetical protein